ncbi:MAG TPA: hypothetical protein VMI31_11350, partial [Fimbriimonadaceae bacterium]|nr:hypothetical protein [Fimbriimonadaceae bacterium]
MPGGRCILIVVHRHGDFNDPGNYVMREMAAMWAEQGHKIVVARGPGPRIEADIVINHIDITVIPVDHLAYFRLYPRVLNGSVVDISKRRISRQLLKPT